MVDFFLFCYIFLAAQHNHPVIIRPLHWKGAITKLRVVDSRKRALPQLRLENEEGDLFQLSVLTWELKDRSSCICVASRGQAVVVGGQHRLCRGVEETSVGVHGGGAVILQNKSWGILSFTCDIWRSWCSGGTDHSLRCTLLIFSDRAKRDFNALLESVFRSTQRACEHVIICPLP